jgi:uncharacterized protein YdaU (DUF1376 family)
MKYYIRHLGDYARDAGYLTTLEHGVYTLLLDWSYATEKGIPREIAYDICKAKSRTEKRAVQRVLETFFFWDGKNGWRHKRVEAEIAKMNEKAEKARKSIKIRWDREKGKQGVEGIRTYNERITNDIQPITHNPKRTPVARVSTAAMLSVVARRPDNG